MAGREDGRLGGRPKLSRNNPWSDPIHYSDGVHLTCPSTTGAVKHEPGWPACAVHGKVRPMFAPLVDAVPRILGRCMDCGEVAPTGSVMCAVCIDDADRAVVGPWLWGPLHPHEPLLAAIGDLR